MEIFNNYMTLTFTGMKEIAIVCRGGQGGITMARILARAGLYEGYYTQAMPQFGAERRGARVYAYLRVSENPIRRRSKILKPDITVVFDEKLGYDENEANLIILNTDKEIDSSKIIVIDANAIASKLNLYVSGWPVLNTAMSGATGKILGFSFESIKNGIEEEIDTKLEENVEAAKMAYGMVE